MKLIDRSGIRKRIDACLKDASMESFDSVGRLDGIEIVQRRDPKIDRVACYTCLKYLRGEISDLDFHILTDEAPPGYMGVDIPEPGNIVVYFNYKIPKHYGIVEEKSMIRSKWGVGHVFRHEAFAVPTNNGNEVRFYRRI